MVSMNRYYYDSLLHTRYPSVRLSHHAGRFKKSFLLLRIHTSNEQRNILAQKAGVKVERVNDNKCESYSIGDMTILCDRSETRLVPVHSQLPHEYFVKRPVVTRYKMTNSVLAIEQDGEYVTDFYIESEHPITKDVLQEDISSFLSRVN